MNPVDVLHRVEKVCTWRHQFTPASALLNSRGNKGGAGLKRIAAAAEGDGLPPDSCFFAHDEAKV